MIEGDLSKTQRDPGAVPATELAAAGFGEAEEIGQGGFGTVYRCVQPDLDRMVAVKVLTVEPAEQDRARFAREQRAMGRLTGHPNIVEVLQVGHTRTGRPYLVMPYYRQGSLEAKIHREGPLPTGDVLQLGVKIADALANVHSLGIVHRDVKPANILFSDYGEPALADFGIAHIAGAFRTSTGVITGSPAFTAPEVLEGDPPTPASDVYGLGATMFCALTGHAAFERRSGEQVVAQFVRITTAPVPNLRESDFPAGISTIIEKAMARDAHERPTAAAFAEELRRIGCDGEAAPNPPGATDADGRGELSAPPRLPAELTSFVGRRSELTEICHALTTARLVTLTGIGGVGKTRLALRAAASAVRIFSDGVWLVELGALHDEAAVVDEVAATLGIRNRSSVPQADLLVAALTPGTTLLVLDNCEQVIAAVAELAQTLLAHCPHLRILTTSREALGIGGETVVRVPPLTTLRPVRAPSLRSLSRCDAVALFLERAAATVPGFELSEDNMAPVAAICERLDGLPLAIELAAARLRALSPEQILDRLTDRFALLTRSSRDAPPRQQTLRLCIEWSYDLCTPAEQQLWAELSLFAGSFDLDDAEHVCSDADQLLDTLSSLVDKSILVREDTDDEVRFRLLDTVREYGRDKIERTDACPDLRTRHRNWYTQLARDAETDWISPRQLEWSRRLVQELPNLRQAFEFGLTGTAESALEIAAALRPFWLSRGLLGEGRRWLDRALDQPGHQPARQRAKAIYAVCMLATFQGDPAAADIRAGQARALDTDSADTATHALVAIAEGITAVCGDDPGRALPALRDAVDGFCALGELRLHLGALLYLGWAYQLNEQVDQALANHEEALELAEAHDEYLYRTFALWSCGIDRWRGADSDRAIRLLEEGLTLSLQAADPAMAFTCLQALSWIITERNDPHRAAVLMGAADALGRIMGGAPVFFPNLPRYQQQFERRARKQLGVAKFETAHCEGRAMSMAQAVAYTLGERSPKRTSTEHRPADLTRRERQVADLIAQGLTNKAIATRLVISQRTAEGHADHIRTKLGFNSRAQIAVWMAEQQGADRGHH